MISSSIHDRVSVWKCQRNHKGYVCQKYVHLIDDTYAILFDEPIETVIVDPLKKFQPVLGWWPFDILTVTKNTSNMKIVFTGKRIVQHVTCWRSLSAQNFISPEKRCRSTSNGSFDALTGKYNINLNGSHPAVLAAIVCPTAVRNVAFDLIDDPNAGNSKYTKYLIAYATVALNIDDVLIGLVPMDSIDYPENIKGRTQMGR